ncbi:MAG: sll0787 family AIR synthase-like protein [Myxococcales bacterium]|nr:sll0787 family AIR synthase-like protein [Myxococcales bacterium]
MSVRELAALAERLRDSAPFRSKSDIARVAFAVDPAPRAVKAWREQEPRIWLGDDTAAIPDGDGYLLLAAEGMLPAFVAQDPYFAGWSSVMVNVNDVAAMGGHPLAVVDVSFSAPGTSLGRVLAGMRDAGRAYGVPLVGGHTSLVESGGPALAVAILGRAERLTPSFGARPGDVLLSVVDLRGGYRAGFPFWNTTEGRGAPSLRGDLEALTALAGTGLVRACKDVSNAGVAGTVVMMLEASGAGGVLDVGRLPRPEGVDLERWLLTFPSFGFVLAVAADDVRAVQLALEGRGLSCEPAGRVDATSMVRLAQGGAEAVLWDLRGQPFTGFGPPPGAR